MRVIQVVGHFTPERCGVAHYTARLAVELCHQGIDVAIACGSASECPNVPVQTIRRFPESVLGLVNLVQMSRAWKADWLHLQFAPGTFDRRRQVTLVPLVARLFGDRPRVAATIHEYGGWPVRGRGFVEGAANAVFARAERAGWLDRETLTLLSFSDLTIVTNADHVESIRGRSEALAGRLSVVPIGPNVTPIGAPGSQREFARQRLGVDADQTVLMFFGFVHPVKGVEHLIRAVKRARERVPRLALWIVGGVHSLALRGAEADGYGQAVCDLIVGEGVADVVDFPGYLSDDEVAARLAAADVAVLPFNHGVTLKSGTLVTCLRHGVPTIATIGGNLGHLRHGENVWLVPPRDSEALAEAIVTLARDPRLRGRLAEAGVEASRQFSWDAIVAKHLELYEAKGARVGGFGLNGRPSP